MKRSQGEDARLGETRDVLLRLQRFSDDPDKVEFQAVTSDASPRPRRVAIVAVSAVAAIALIAVGTFALLGSHWPAGTSVVLNPPVVSNASVVSKAPAVSIAPVVSNAPVVSKAPVASNAPKVPIQVTPGAGAAMVSSAPKVTAEDRARAEQFLARGEEYLADGNVMGARGFFERAADFGLAAGALRLAETYDPGALQRLQVHGVVPDLDLARRWYERARDLGAPEAAGRLASLSAK